MKKQIDAYDFEYETNYDENNEIGTLRAFLQHVRGHHKTAAEILEVLEESNGDMSEADYRNFCQLEVGCYGV